MEQSVPRFPPCDVFHNRGPSTSEEGEAGAAPGTTDLVWIPRVISTNAPFLFWDKYHMARRGGVSPASFTP